MNGNAQRKVAVPRQTKSRARPCCSRCTQDMFTLFILFSATGRHRDRHGLCMSRRLLLLAIYFCSAIYAGDAVENNVDLPRFPSLCPDGENICFSWHGHLWRAPVRGGAATRLTAHSGEDLRSAW